jgi:hypothetical protein
MAQGVKLLIVAKEATGKTTLISSIKDGLVISTDNKAFSGKVPHFRYSSYSGIQDFIATTNEKIGLYNEKYGKFPGTIVIDSVTHFQIGMERWANDKFTGFNIWSNLSKEILTLNAYIEDTLLSNGVNVVITAHCNYDSETARYEINSPGNFGKQGSWLSITDNSAFIEVKNGKRVVHHTNTKFPCRSNLANIPESQSMEEYDLNAHITALAEMKTESEEFVL